MISRLDGTVLRAVGQRLVVGIGGIGLAVHVTPQQSLAATVGEPITLHTALIVREDDLSLFGFGSEDELTAFDLLRGISGVGPKSALGVVSHVTPEQLADAVAREDDSVFRAVSGIGPKTAKLIVVQLAGKLPAFTSAVSATTVDFANDVVVALTGLGYPERHAKAAIGNIVDDGDAAATASAGSLLRAALQVLGPKA